MLFPVILLASLMLTIASSDVHSQLSKGNKISYKSLLPDKIKKGKEMERMKHSEHYVHQGKVRDKNVNHEVVIGVKHKNLDKLEEYVLRRSKEVATSTEDWMSFGEIGDLTSNTEGYLTIATWLRMSGMKIVWTSKRFEFMKVHGTIAQWEQLLQTEFHTYKHIESNEVLPRAKAYHVPHEIHPHMDAMFYVSQLPPKIHKHIHSRNDMQSDISAMDSNIPDGHSTTPVTVSFLRSLYNITLHSGIIDM